MNCKAFQAYFETNPHFVIDPRSEFAEVEEHAARCSKCNRSLEEQKELGKCLDAVRNSAPEMSASLDGAVLANYRRCVSEQSRSAVPVPLKGQIGLRGAFSWGIAVAFAVVVAYGAMFLFIPNQHNAVGRKYADRQLALPPTQPMIVSRKMTDAQKPAHGKSKSVAASARHTKNASSVVEQDTAFPTRFQGLMYCDQLSCLDPLDVIRVQLPSPVLGVTPFSTPATNVVSADVLVGPDGIARGIRVIE